MTEQEQQFSIFLAVEFGVLAFVVLGVAVWTGWWRSWAKNDNAFLQGIAGVPWLALTAITVRVGFYVIERPFYVDLPAEAWHVATLVCFAIGIIAPYWHFPKWALPPWYRKHLQYGQAQNDVGDEVTR